MNSSALFVNECTAQTYCSLRVSMGWCTGTWEIEPYNRPVFGKTVIMLHILDLCKIFLASEYSHQSKLPCSFTCGIVCGVWCRAPSDPLSGLYCRLILHDFLEILTQLGFFPLRHRTAWTSAMSSRTCFGRWWSLSTRTKLQTWRKWPIIC